MDIYLTDIATGDRLRFPMMPQSINLKREDLFQSYTLINIGNAKLPSGEGLGIYSWEGILPGIRRRSAPYVRAWRDPEEIQAWWRIRMTQKKMLRLLITETPINRDVYLESYAIDYKGAYGDYHYKISFVQARDIVIRPVEIAVASPVAVPARPAPPPAKTHTVVSGDTLWWIAQQHYGRGADYPKLYSVNKDAIEAEAKRRGFRNSDNGHWIFPGTVLTLP